MGKRRKGMLTSVKLTSLFFSWLIHLVSSENATSAGNEPKVFNNFFDPKYHDNGEEAKIVEYKPLESVQEFSVIKPSESYAIEDPSYGQQHQAIHYPHEQLASYNDFSSGHGHDSSTFTKAHSVAQYHEQVQPEIRFHNQPEVQIQSQPQYVIRPEQSYGQPPPSKVKFTDAWTPIPDSYPARLKWPQQSQSQNQQQIQQQEVIYESVGANKAPVPRPYVFEAPLSEIVIPQPAYQSQSYETHEAYGPPSSYEFPVNPMFQEYGVPQGRIVNNAFSGNKPSQLQEVELSNSYASAGDRPPVENTESFSPGQSYHYGGKPPPVSSDFSSFHSPKPTHFENFQSILPENGPRPLIPSSYKPPVENQPPHFHRERPRPVYKRPSILFENKPAISYPSYENGPVKAIGLSQAEINDLNSGGYPSVEYTTKNPTAGSLTSFYGSSGGKIPDFDDGFSYTKSHSPTPIDFKGLGKPLKSYYTTAEEYNALLEELKGPSKAPPSGYSQNPSSHPVNSYGGQEDYFQNGWETFSSVPSSPPSDSWPSLFSSRPTKFRSPYGSYKKPGSVSDEHQFDTESSYGVPSDLRRPSSSGYFYNPKAKGWQRVPYMKPDTSYGVPQDLEHPSSAGYYKTNNGGWTRMPYAQYHKGITPQKYSTLTVPLEEEESFKEIDPSCENRSCQSIRGLSNYVELTRRPMHHRKRPRGRNTLFKRLMKNIAFKTRGKPRRPQRRPCRGRTCHLRHLSNELNYLKHLNV